MTSVSEVSPGQIALSDDRSISQLVRTEGARSVIERLIVLVELVQNQFNINQKMNAGQVFIMCEELIEDYKNYKLADFEKLFSLASKNHFGKLEFNRIDKPVIYGWLEKYDIGRNEDIIKLNVMKKNQPEYHTVKNPVQAEKFGQLAEGLLKKFGKSKETPITVNPGQALYQEFDKLFSHQDEGKGGLRSVKYKGWTFSQDEYIALRIEELIHEKGEKM